MLIISIIQSSLSLSLGLIGVLSIVRFRSAIKDPEELIYLFLSIVIGFGAQQKEITIISFTIIVVIIIVKHIFSFAVTFWVQIDNMEKLSNVQKILEAKYPNLNINLLEDNSSSSIFN